MLSGWLRSARLLCVICPSVHASVGYVLSVVLPLRKVAQQCARSVLEFIVNQVCERGLAHLVYDEGACVVGMTTYFGPLLTSGFVESRPRTRTSRIPPTPRTERRDARHSGGIGGNRLSAFGLGKSRQVAESVLRRSAYEHRSQRISARSHSEAPVWKVLR